MNTADSTARAIIGIVKLLFSKVFLRAIVLFIVIVFVSSYFPWTDTFYSSIFPNPELRIRFDPSREQNAIDDLPLFEEWWFQRAVVIENQGNSVAESVFISASVPWGRITRHAVYSDYPYTVTPSETEQGVLTIELSQLPPDAKVRLYIWGTQPRNIEQGSAFPDQANVEFSAVHAMGSAPIGPEQSSSEQIKSTANRILSDLYTSGIFIRDNPQIESTISSLESGELSIPIPDIPIFLAISVLTLAVVAWIFLDPIKASLLIGVLGTGAYWLRVANFYLPPNVMIFVSLVVLCILALNEGVIGFITDRFTSLIYKREQSPFFLDFEQRSWLTFVLSIILLIIGIALNNGMLSSTHQLASYYSIAYVLTISALHILQ